MFRRDKDDGDDKKAPDDDGDKDIGTPPLKPFSTRGTHGPAKPAAQPGAARPNIPRQVSEIPSAPRRGDRGRPGQSEGNKLTVGRDIRLKGEITACDKLVVEGRVEASLTDARVIEVAPTGYYKGDAQVDEADISGRFEGQLMARDKLTVRAEGRISGSIRYGSIVIESGGEVSGDMRTLDGTGEAADDGKKKPATGTS
ncbi:MAG: polymer-forming cytoskeletal protein [Rhodospirillales bacterium]|jgi:cytoskeletal protein CcmA (bactofilin family)|nr:polymer-forming cytoskeletal protein [Rhodospirillales bacterium]MDP6882493.1 polymer-forming cytoskeletal protein [Rhodospirillales bacterium]